MSLGREKKGRPRDKEEGGKPYPTGTLSFEHADPFSDAQFHLGFEFGYELVHGLVHARHERSESEFAFDLALVLTVDVKLSSSSSSSTGTG